MSKPIVYRAPRSRQRRLAQLAPSSYWKAEINAGRVRTFPPLADGAPMVKCQSAEKQCGGSFYPGYYVREDCCCEDCHNQRLLAEEQRRQREGTLAGFEEDRPESPMAEAMTALRRIRGVIAEIPLPSESSEDLVREIARVRETGKIVVIYSNGSEVDVEDPPPPQPQPPAWR